MLSTPDFSFHTIQDNKLNFTLSVGSSGRQLDKKNSLFRKMFKIFGYTGRCWISSECFVVPQLCRSQIILPEVRIFYNTVKKGMTKIVL